jgi:hypothetical protein
MAKKPQTKPKTGKSVASGDDLTKTTEGGIELTEAELSRASGGFSVKGTPIAVIQPLAHKIS